MPEEAYSTLPPLTLAQAEHSAAVLRVVRAALEANAGWLAFDEYLRLVLYAPGVGYYSAGSVKFGPAGDFITAPEVSELFARALARECAGVLSSLGGGDLLELGAGTGRLAVGLLRHLAELDALPARYLILETSAELRERQRALAAAALPSAVRARIAG